MLITQIDILKYIYLYMYTLSHTDTQIHIFSFFLFCRLADLIMNRSRTEGANPTGVSFTLVCVLYVGFPRLEEILLITVSNIPLQRSRSVTYRTLKGPMA